MSNMLYRVINPIVKGLLRSPLHGVMSKNTLLLEFKGRRSGRTLSTPVSYHTKGGHVHCFSSKDYPWWRNLVDADSVALTLRGRRVIGKPSVTIDEPEIMKAALTEFLTAVPRDAAHAGVALDENERPVERQVAKAVAGLVYISIELSNEQATSTV